MCDMRLGNGPNSLRMEWDFSKLPKFQMLTEAYREMEIEAEKHTDAQPSCEHFGLSPREFFSQGRLTRSSAKY